MIRLRSLVIAGAAVVAVTGCVAPAPSPGAFEGKAVQTAKAALSSVDTALLASATAVRGRLPQPYLETTLSSAEDSLSSIQTAFDSVQPPATATSDRLRDTLDRLLSRGSDGLAQLRIASRREDHAVVAEATRSLQQVADGLDRFEQEHSG
ncbi:MAG TPA: hypothetical protein VEL73_10290 [Mycobacteriales bacterium]|nr:hypothetical protein [Mycobacteriales bacterium]